MSDILVTENIVGDGMTALRKAFDVVFEPDLHEVPQELLKVISQFKALVVRNQTQVDGALVAAADHLRVIGRAGVGLDNLDLAAVSKAGIVVAYTPDQNSVSVAELALALMLGLARNICPADASTKSGDWLRHEFTGGELFNKTCGVIGMGRIGFLTAMRARAFGMDILVHDAFVHRDAAAVTQVCGQMVDMEELFARSDYISCHLPATEKTQQSLGYEMFSKMKTTAYFINTSRGQVVCEDGLIRALTERKLAGAALDVRQVEPPGRDQLTEMPNVILTPHIGAFTREAQVRVVQSVCQDVASVLIGEAACNYANFSRPNRK
ncbi:MAG: hypothetical protein CMJ20_06325 [Phycisphaeraceae bacterium]|nr:hypothetical protein [Phycisphaeraceae bacterium]